MFYQSRIAACSIVLVYLVVFSAKAAYSQESLDIRHTRSSNADAILTFSDKAVKFEIAGGKCLPNAPAIYNNVAYVSTTNSNVIAFGNSKIEKEYQIGGGLSSSPLVTEKQIVVGSTSKFIISIDRESGKTRWKFKTKHPVKYTPIEINGMIYAGTEGGKLLAIDSVGKLHWSFDAKAPITSPSYDGNVVYIGTEQATCFAVNAATGKQIWKADVAGRIPCIGDSLLYCQNRNGAVVAISKRTGQERWRYDADATSSAFEIALSPTGLAYVSDDMLIILDPESGKKLWDMHFKQPLCGAPLIVGTAVYVPCSDWNLYAFDLATGMELAHTDIGFAPWGSPSYSNGKIFFPNKETLYIISSVEQ